VHLDVRFSCDLANVPSAAADAFKASADRLFAGGPHRSRSSRRPTLVAPGARPGRSRPARPPLPAPPRRAHRGRRRGGCRLGPDHRGGGARGRRSDSLAPTARPSATKIHWRPSSWRGGWRQRWSWRAARRRESSLRRMVGRSGGAGDFLDPICLKGAPKRALFISGYRDARNRA
jgi:hypothetical protein